jgi:biotin transport system ATP-binding protein
MGIEITDLEVAADGPEGRTTLLHGVTAQLSARTTAIIGENGSGKSTLARAIGGLDEPAAGRVLVDGLDTVRDARSLRSRVGYLFANPAAQVIMPTVREDVALTLRGRGLPRRAIAERVEAALSEHGLSDLADRPCLSLSSGQLQRLALCSVWVGEPELVIADEPTSLLDARHHRIVSERLLGITREGVPVAGAPRLLLVTHDLSLAARCEEAVLVDGGRISAQGPPAAVLAAYEEVLDRQPDHGGARRVAP